MGAIETELNRVIQSSYSSKRQSVPIPASFASVEQAGSLLSPNPPSSTHATAAISPAAPRPCWSPVDAALPCE